MDGKNLLKSDLQKYIGTLEKNKTTEKDKEVEEQNSSDKKTITKLLIAVLLLILIIVTVIIISTKYDSKSDLGINNNNNTDSITDNIITEPTEDIVYSSEGIVTDREQTTLEEIGLKDKMFVPDYGKMVCSNCGRHLDAYDDYFTMVITEADSFVKLTLCNNCFNPMKELLSDIGF